MATQKNTAIYTKIIILVLSVIAFAGGLYLGSQKQVSITDLQLPDTDKKLRSGSEWLGQVVVVNHWATWCAPCREEIPLLVEYQRRHGVIGVQVIGVAHDRLDKVKEFGEEFGINYPSLVAVVGGSEIMQSHKNSSGGLPFTAFFDRTGKLIHTELGQLNADDLQRIVKPLL